MSTPHSRISSDSSVQQQQHHRPVQEPTLTGTPTALLPHKECVVTVKMQLDESTDAIGAARPPPERKPTIPKQGGIGARPECFDSTLQEVLFAAMTTMAIAMSALLEGATTVITATVGNDLAMTSAQITWVSASSALTAGSFLLFFSKIADTFGRRGILISSMGAFALSNLITGFATNAMYLDIFNGILGLWSAASVPPAIGILGAAYSTPSRRKNMAFACFSAGNPVGFVVGSISSGIATHLFNWRASFFFLAIVYLVCFIITFFAVPHTKQITHKLTAQSLKDFDLFGTFLTITSLAAFCTALSISTSAPKGWGTDYVLVLLILGIVMIIGFLLWEWRCQHPLMPLGIWRDKNFCLVNAIVMLGFMSLTASGFWLSLFMQRVQNHSPLGVAVRLLPQAIAGILVNIVAGLTLHHVSNKMLIGIGTLSYTISALLLALMKADSMYWAFIFPSLIFSVIGADMQFNVANMYVMSSLPPHQQSLGGGVFNTVIKLCITLGLAISTSIYNGTASPDTNTVMYPYTMAFWFSVASAGAGLVLVPFLTIGTQGNEIQENEERDAGVPRVSQELPADEKAAEEDM